MLVDHKQPGVDVSPVLRIDGAVDGGRKHDTPTFLKTNEGFNPRWIIRRHACTGDGDQTPTVAKTCQG
jgi:hypothetical protein